MFMNNKSKKNIFIIVISAMLVLVAVLLNRQQSFDEQKESISTQIKYGRYYNEDRTEFVIISESGNALFFPTKEHMYVGYSVRYYCKPYEFKDNILTINVGKAYWKFELKNDVLQCIEYKYAGVVTDVRDENMCYQYAGEVTDIVYGISYSGEQSRKIVVSEDEILLDFYGGSGSDKSISAPYTRDGDNITVELDGRTALLKVNDGNIYLKEMMFFEYEEYMGEGMEFVPEYEIEDYEWRNEDNRIDRDKYYEEADELPVPAGHYYNADKTAEIIIGEDGFGKYYPSVDSMASYNGKWEYDGKMLTLTDVASYYTGYDENGINWTYTNGQCRFKVNGEKISFTEYIDDKGRSKRYAGEEFVFSYAGEELIDKLRPGGYKFETNESGNVVRYELSSDGKGRIYIYIIMHDEEWSLPESGSGFGTFTRDDDVITATFENGDYIRLIIVDGKLLLTDYKLGGLEEVKGEEIALEYVGDGFEKIEY